LNALVRLKAVIGKLWNRIGVADNAEVSGVALGKFRTPILPLYDNDLSLLFRKIKKAQSKKKSEGLQCK
jgi:UTP:GlnB (protein PII) uridylyltransferase